MDHPDIVAGIGHGVGLSLDGDVKGNRSHDLNREAC